MIITKWLHVEYYRDRCLAHLSFFNKQNDVPKRSKYLKIFIFLLIDDTNLFPNTTISNLETHLNGELQKVCQLFYPLNIKKPFLWYSILPHRRIADKLNLSASNMSVKSDNQVKCLGLLFDPNLNLKS